MRYPAGNVALVHHAMGSHQQPVRGRQSVFHKSNLRGPTSGSRLDPLRAPREDHCACRLKLVASLLVRRKIFRRQSPLPPLTGTSIFRYARSPRRIVSNIAKLPKLLGRRGQADLCATTVTSHPNGSELDAWYRRSAALGFCLRIGGVGGLS